MEILREHARWVQDDELCFGVLFSRDVGGVHGVEGRLERAFMEVELQGVWRRRVERSDAERVVVVGGMHGDERMGAAVIQELQDATHAIWEASDPVHVDVVLGNPMALEVSSRGTSSGRDLNRMFGPETVAEGESFESLRARELRTLVEGAARLIDLHQTHCDTPPLAVVSDTPAHLQLVARLGLEIAVVGTDRVYGACMIADLINRLGGIGITVETGRAETPEAFTNGRDVVQRFLTLDSSPLESLKPVRVLELAEAVPCPGPGLRFRKALGNTSRLKAGEVWAEWEGGELVAPRDVVVLLPHDDVAPGRACALFATDRGLFHPEASR